MILRRSRTETRPRMAFLTTADGTKLYWEESGSGAPLLLIQGLGWSAEMWYSLVPELETAYRVIRYEERVVARRAGGAGVRGGRVRRARQRPGRPPAGPVPDGGDGRRRDRGAARG